VSRVFRLFELLDKVEKKTNGGRFHVITVDYPVDSEPAPVDAQTDAERMAAREAKTDAATAKAKAAYEAKNGPIGADDVVFIMKFSAPSKPRQVPRPQPSAPPGVLPERQETWIPPPAREQEHNWPVPQDGIRTEGEWGEPLKYGPSLFPEADVVHDPRRYKPISYADEADN
jgi:hypothetical protein